LSNLKKDKKSKIPTLLDPLSGKNKREEFENMIHELDERKSMLDNLESQLTTEKENINKKRDEFFKWREKLEVLEDEIENRRTELVEQERMFNDRFVSASDKSISDKFEKGDNGLAFNVKKDEETSEPHRILDKIPECAAIVQRGILKQVNRPFVELLGYDKEEVFLEKSLLDFVASEGLSGIEEYYLNRLKGVAVSNYETIFLTNDNRMIHVEIITKPVVYNGEKADIALVKNLKYMEQEKGIDQ
jgi:PAS domain S-box-containing protein